MPIGSYLGFVPDYVLLEMQQVGALPTAVPKVIGKTYTLNDQSILITGEISKEEFCERLRSIGLPDGAYKSLDAYFYTFSVD